MAPVDDANFKKKKKRQTEKEKAEQVKCKKKEVEKLVKQEAACEGYDQRSKSTSENILVASGQSHSVLL